MEKLPKITEQMVFNEAYKFTFKEVCQEPHSRFCVYTNSSFQLFWTGTEFIATTRVRRFTVNDGVYLFPYLPITRTGRPSMDNRWKTYRCAEAVPITKYQKTFKKEQSHLFINGSDRSKPIGMAIRLIEKQIRMAEQWRQIIEHSKKDPHFSFWTAQDRDYWERFGKGGFNDNGFMFLLKRDEGRFKYSKVVKTEDFVKILELSRALPRYKYFFDTLVELGYAE